MGIMRVMKTLVVIGYVWPEPDSSAAGSRMLQLIRLFQELDFRILFASAAEESAHAPDLRALGIEAVPIVLNCSSFNEWIAAVQPDAVMFDRFMMEEQFGWRVEEACPQALRFLDMEDVHCLRDARHRALKENRAVSAADFHSDLAYREIASVLRCDLTFVISEAEMTLLSEQFPVPLQQLCYTPFLVSEAVEEGPGFHERMHFVSIGNFRHAPNWDAVLQLKALWPQIRRQLPQAEMHIYGAYPPPKATQLHSPRDGFLVKGWAADASAVIGNARVMLAPLRFGAGLKGKLLDAARLGTPAVTTPVGAEGMYGELPAPALIASEESAFVDAAVRLYSDEVLWSEHHRRGRQVIGERFSPDIQGHYVKKRLNDLMNGTSEQRQGSFLSGMLRHHSLKATRYMSQWIEAKNRLRQEED